MKRTTVMLPDKLDQRLRREARRRGVPLAELVREALASYFPAEQSGELSFFAVGEGEPDDVAARSDEFVADAIARRHDER